MIPFIHTDAHTYPRYKCKPLVDLLCVLTTLMISLPPYWWVVLNIYLVGHYTCIIWTLVFYFFWILWSKCNGHLESFSSFHCLMDFILFTVKISHLLICTLFPNGNLCFDHLRVRGFPYFIYQWNVSYAKLSIAIGVCGLHPLHPNALNWHRNSSDTQNVKILSSFEAQLMEKTILNLQLAALFFYKLFQEFQSEPSSVSFEQPSSVAWHEQAPSSLPPLLQCLLLGVLHQ